MLIYVDLNHTLGGCFLLSVVKASNPALAGGDRPMNVANQTPCGDVMSRGAVPATVGYLEVLIPELFRLLVDTLGSLSVNYTKHRVR